MLFPILAWKVYSESESIVDDFNMAGFIVQAVLQSGATFLLFLALDHERKYRSSGEAKFVQ